MHVAIVVMLTAVLMTAFFGYMNFELYGEESLCRQKYDLPLFSFYAERFDCFVSIGDLAADVERIAVLVSGPLLLSGVTILCVVQWRRWTVRSGGRLKSDAESSPVDVVSQARLLAWIFTASLGLAGSNGGSTPAPLRSRLLMQGKSLWRPRWWVFFTLPGSLPGPEHLRLPALWETTSLYLAR